MAYKIYVAKSYKKWLVAQSKKQRILDKLDIVPVPSGTIAIDKKPGGYGVLDKNGKLVKESLFYRNKTPQYTPLKPDEKLPYFDFDIVYLGNIDPAFGHFFLEHWNRAWAFLDPKYRDMKFVMVNDLRLAEVPRYVTYSAELLGIPKENFIVTSSPAKYRNVYVPCQGFNIPVYSSKEFGETFTATAANVKGQGAEKIYVSRAKLKSRRTYGEEKVSKIFEKNGFKIVYPETLTFTEHVAFMRDCKVLAGSGGSALHMSLFMPVGAKVIQLKRNSLIADNAPTQKLLCDTKNQDFTVVSASIEKYKTVHGAMAPQIIGVTRELIKFFDDNGFEYSENDLKFDQMAWEHYMVALDEYMTSTGSPLRARILNKTMMLLAIFIPGRRARARFRKWFRRICKF